jgi:hypothetical protein
LPLVDRIQVGITTFRKRTDGTFRKQSN